MPEITPRNPPNDKTPSPRLNQTKAINRKSFALLRHKNRLVCKPSKQILLLNDGIDIRSMTCRSRSLLDADLRIEALPRVGLYVNLYCLASRQTKRGGESKSSVTDFGATDWRWLLCSSVQLARSPLGHLSLVRPSVLKVGLEQGCRDVREDTASGLEQ